MILGYTNTLLYNAFLESAIPPTNSDFDTLRMCGNLTVDELQVLSRVLTKAEILAMTGEQEFGTFTILLAHFEDKLQGGNFDSGGEDITAWNILRRRTGELNYSLLAQVPNSAVTNYLDIRAQSGLEYEYAIQAVASGTTGNLVESEAVSMSFYGWSLQSLDFNPETSTGTQYIFDVEINTDALRVNRARAEIETYNQFIKVYRGEANYVRGGLKTFPLECTSEGVVEPNLTFLNTVRDFIEDGNEKILKNGSGEIYRVDTHDFSHQYRDRLTNQAPTSTNVNAQPYDISFKFVQVGNE